MHPKSYQEKDWLVAHWNKADGDLSIKEIAQTFMRSPATIRYWLQKYGLLSKPLYRDGSWLYQKYAVEGLADSDIARLCDCHPQTIATWRLRHGIRAEDKAREQQSRPLVFNAVELEGVAIEELD